MSQHTPTTQYLKDYRPPAFKVVKVDLVFELGDEQTRVSSRLLLQRQHPGELILNGGKELQIESLKLDGQLLQAEDYQQQGEEWRLQPADEAVLECVTLLKPQDNTSLEGLYRSGGMFCTQCEAEGFRQITLYPDRPDVMSVFTTTLIAEAAAYPVLLSNGNLLEQGSLEDGRHFARWHDPFPKPSYLFAMVAGDLGHIEDKFTTCSGRQVTLRLYTEHHNLSKTPFAMEALKRSMRWDEEVYGREYDLDIFNIVAVDDFNMGAMENKSLNIFNSSCVLARADTTTDAGFARIEGIVAHEYFHNWSGNRVTCRDWFQLSLKEGFTVFRDAQFSADMGSAAVKRIEDVTLLRTAQFAEDAGPTAHPVRPDNYMEISNFYTLTVYEKGAEVVRMLHTLLGAELFRQGSDLYFQRFDGQAVTCDDFVACMAEVSGRDLSQFMRWYTQAGTPRLQVTDSYDESTGKYQLQVRQSCPPTPGQSDKAPFHIPLAIALLDQQGQELVAEQVLDVTEAEQVFEFVLPSRPQPSLLRGFSAPVKLDYPYTRQQLRFLMSQDSDGFNRWEAGQRLAVQVLQEQQAAYLQQQPLQLDADLADAFATTLQQTQLDPAVAAKVLALPSEAYLAELAEVIEVEAIHYSREGIKQQLGEQLYEQWLARYQASRAQGGYQFNSAEVGRRALNLCCLAYLVASGRPAALELAEQHYRQADNMTDSLGALGVLVQYAPPEQSQALLDDFYQRWQEDSLVVNQWLALQCATPNGEALARAETLLHHPAFEWRNPNKVRSVLGAFGQNTLGLHRADGQGYSFLAKQISYLDAINPQIAARLLTPLTRWKRYPATRQQQMKAALQTLAQGALSKDAYEIVNKSLA